MILLRTINFKYPIVLIIYAATFKGARNAIYTQCKVAFVSTWVAYKSGHIFICFICVQLNDFECVEILKGFHIHLIINVNN